MSAPGRPEVERPRARHEGPAAGAQAVTGATAVSEDPPVAAAWTGELYRQLRVLARWRLRDGGRNTLLDTTALVHETFLRMGGARATADERRQLLAYASFTMRSVIVDAARRRQAVRRGGEACIVTLTEGLAERAPAAADQIVQVHEALLELETVDPRLARVVEMRFFAGLTDAEIADALAVSERTVRRDWDKARLVLARALRS
jgi:RNA polymerase sigma factor (TIGR02999 family)